MIEKEKQKEKEKKVDCGPVETPETEGKSQLDNVVAKQLDQAGFFKITNGVAEIKGKGRFYLFKGTEKDALDKKTQYLCSPNVEVSCDIKVDEIQEDGKTYPGIEPSDKKFINIGGCTNHFTNVEKNSNGRNYSVVFRLDRNGLGFKKETIHGVYDEDHLKEEKMQLGRWYNIKYRQTVQTNTGTGKKELKLEGWVDNTLFGGYIDSGQMTEDTSKTQPLIGNDNALYFPIQNAKQVWTAGAYSGLYIRLTGTVKTQIKNLTIKEI